MRYSKRLTEITHVEASSVLLMRSTETKAFSDVSVRMSNFWKTLENAGVERERFSLVFKCIPISVHLALEMHEHYEMFQLIVLLGWKIYRVWIGEIVFFQNQAKCLTSKMVYPLSETFFSQ